MTIAPLKQKDASGKPYQRSPEIESLIEESMGREFSKFLNDANTSDMSYPNYIPSEVLIYHARKNENIEHREFNKLFVILYKRALALSPQSEISMSREKNEDANNSDWREKSVGKLIELILRDKTSYEVKLDEFEVQFDHAFVSLAIDSDRQIRKPESKKVQVDINDVNGVGEDGPITDGQIEHSTEEFDLNKIDKIIWARIERAMKALYGVDLEETAEKLSLPRSFLADLHAKFVRVATIPNEFLEELANEIGVYIPDVVMAMLQQIPLGIFFSSKVKPGESVANDFLTFVNESELSEEQKTRLVEMVDKNGIN